MSKCNFVFTLLNTSIKLINITEFESIADQKEYQIIVNELIFVIIAIRLNIMCTIDQLLQFNNNSSSKHILAAKRILRYLQDINALDITYKKSLIKLIDLSDTD